MKILEFKEKLSIKNKILIAVRSISRYFNNYSCFTLYF